MHHYIPAGIEERQALISELGHSSIEDLFKSIPSEIRLQTSNRLTPAMSEIELRRYFQSSGPSIEHSFAGGLGHLHYIPSIIDPLVSRGEFLTAYTPYQPEVSQGTLQAMFEYQSMMAELMGVQVSNASLYDGSTSVVEAINMGLRISGKTKAIVSSLLHPEYLEVLKTYAAPGILQYEIAAASESRGALDPGSLQVDSDTGVLVVQSPNFFGLIEDIPSIKKALPPGVILVVVITEALSMALLKAAGSMGADIVCGEAQSFGIPLMAGGPWLGFLGSSMEHVRNMPGRLIGQARDAEGKRAFVVTLATREQHIRRARATSNICTNGGLMALRAAIYLSVMGKQGLRRAALRCHRFATYGLKALGAHSELQIPYASSFFNEIVVQLPVRADLVLERCIESQGILPGTVIGEKTLLVAFHEMLSAQIIDRWALLMASACK